MIRKISGFDKFNGLKAKALISASSVVEPFHFGPAPAPASQDGGYAPAPAPALAQ